MISKNNFIKVKSMLSISATNCGTIVIRVSIFIVTLFAFTNIAIALNWQDKEVKETGCPETPIREWKSETLNLHNEKIINIQENKIVIIGNHKSDEYFLRNKKSFKIGEKFIEFNINTDDRKKEVYLKVRPNLINTKTDYENSNNNTYNC
jgi:hypothetical protein